MKKILSICILLICMACESETENKDTTQEQFKNAENLFNSGKYTEAITQLTNLLKAKGTSDIYTLRAYAYLKSGNKENAFKDFSSAYSLNKTDPETLTGLALLHFYKKNYTSVISVANELLTLNKTFKSEREPTFDYKDIVYVASNSYFRNKDYTSTYTLLKAYKTELSFTKEQSDLPLQLILELEHLYKSARK